MGSAVEHRQTTEVTTRNAGAPAGYQHTWGCPWLCWISGDLPAGAEAPQAIVRDFAIFLLQTYSW